MLGRVLDHYRIESKLGEGGMGVVYKARDTQLDRAVAIKVLPTDKVADSSRKQRFVQEAKAASGLNHPNIITIHEICSVDGVDFIVMEYIEGKTLDEVIPHNGLRPRQALHYATHIADALAKAHGAGILHRDLKPSNIMVTDDGRLKVLDFGLAKLLGPSEVRPEGTTLTVRPRTEEGTLLGTTAYMSPEQAEGHQLDARSDIFSLGTILYEMVTGQRPFKADSRLALLNRIVNEEPRPPTLLVASISSDLEKVILRCLRKDPNRRFQTMADLKVALEDLETESASTSQKRLPAARVNSRWWALASVLIVLMMAAFFAWRQWSTPLEPLKAAPLTTLPGEALHASFSPEGTQVAFTWNGPKQDNTDIYVQQIGAGAPLRLTTDPRDDYSPVWSPDGRWIAFLRGESSSIGKSELRLIPPLGGPERQLAQIQMRDVHSDPAYLAWCPDSKCLIVTDSPGEDRPDALFLISLESSEKRQLTNPLSPVLGDDSPALSPDGRSLVFCRTFAELQRQVYLLKLGKNLSAVGEPKRLPLRGLNVWAPTWMPDGRDLLFAAEGNLWKVAVTGEGSPTRLPFVGEDGKMPAVSRPQTGGASRLIYTHTVTDHNIWRIQTSAVGMQASSPPMVAISSTRLENNPQFSPDGRRVVFCSDRSGRFEIWLADPDGANAAQLTSMGAGITCTPRWSPDGQLIVFDSNLEGHFEIYVVPASGGKPRRLTFGQANAHVPSFSRDGKWIYFSSNRGGDYQIWKARASGGEAVQVTRNGGFVAFESPDGAYVYYMQTVFRPSALWRLPLSGGQPVKLLDGLVGRCFAVLEQGIYYLDQLSGENQLEFFDFRSGKSITVERNLGKTHFGLTASPDGRTILFTRVDSSVNDLMLVENFR